MDLTVNTNYYFPVNITKFKKGEVVFCTNYEERNPCMIGHVVKFTISSDNEILIVVDWADGTRSAMHPFDLSFSNI